ncbi:hypothetical protein M0805_001652 [Coniferiporia weirii]|nr:hypothetical protein M0805_001652 [Coniferiporia weirii]
MHVYPRSDVGPNAAQLDPSLVVYWLSTLDQELYCRVAVTSVLLYDIIITMDKEIAYFWSAPRSLVSLIYFLNRYIALFISLFDIKSTALPWSYQIAGWMGILLIDCILMMRVLALFSGNKKLAACLAALFVTEGAVMLGVLVRIETSVQDMVVIILPGRTGCASQGVFLQNWATAYWVPTLVFEVILTALALYKALCYRRECAALGGDGVSGSGSRTSLLTVLVRDQAIYFVLVIICGLASVSSYWIALGQYSSNVSLFANAALPCVLGSRLLCNLKEEAARTSRGGASMSLGGRTTMVSEIRFS